MSIKSSGTAVGTGDVSSEVSSGMLYIKANTGTAVVTIDGHDIKISDSTSYQCFAMGGRSFRVKSGSIDYFTTS